VTAREAAGGRAAPRFIGVDVGGTKVAAALVRDGQTHHRVEHPTDVANGQRLLDGIEVAVGEVIAHCGPPTGVGIGVPSQIDYASGQVIDSVNIPLAGVSLRQELGRRFRVPVYVDNDANCAALAEAFAVGARHLVMLTLGTGVGGGLVLGGSIYRGASGLGAELGHITIDADGPECPGNCPNRGCVEALCSGPALERDATELGRERPHSRLGELVREHDRVTGHQAVALARAGDPDALAVLGRLGRYLGVTIATVLNAFEPDLLVLGGGLSRAADLFLDTARREAHARALPSILARSELALACTGADAGVLGAGLLAAQEEGVAGETG
jgi:glucokinase